MAETQEAPVAGAATTPEPPIVDLGPVTSAIATFEHKMEDRFAQLEERSRANFTIPSAKEPDVRAKRGDWMSAVIRMLSGERVNDLQVRELADLVSVPWRRIGLGLPALDDVTLLGAPRSGVGGGPGRGVAGTPDEHRALLANLGRVADVLAERAHA